MTECFGIRLSKTKTILLLIIGIVALTALGIAPYQLSTYSFAKEVPIELGYNDVENYWILSSVISEKETFKMVLHAEDTEAVDGETEAKAESEVGLLFNPLLPISETDLTPYHITYQSQAFSKKAAPSYDVNDAGWLTTARYTVAVHKNGIELSKKEVNINYKEPRVITIETPEGEVTITNLGILPQGVEVPSGDLVAVQGPYDTSDFRLWSKIDFIRMIDAWNSVTAGFGVFDYGWTDVWEYSVRHGHLPTDVNLVHVSQVEYIGDMDYVRLYYADIVFAGDITIYIPSELADTIIVHLYEPKPEITAIDPSPLPTINEGDSFTLSVTIKNVGTEGSISVSLTSERYAANPITETFADFKEGESLTFRWTVYALNVVADTPTELKVFAQGRGGDDTNILKGTILDVPGYTPPDPEPGPTPVPPRPPTFPWEWLIIAVVGIFVVWYFMRSYKRR